MKCVKDGMTGYLWTRKEQGGRTHDGHGQAYLKAQENKEVGNVGMASVSPITVLREYYCREIGQALV